MYYKIYCKETYPYLPVPVGELRPYFEGAWRVRMFDRFLCPSGFTGTFAECADYLKSWFHGRLVECDSPRDIDAQN